MHQEISMCYIEKVVEMQQRKSDLPSGKSTLQWFMCFHFAESVAFATSRFAWLLLLDKHVKALAIPTWAWW